MAETSGFFQSVNGDRKYGSAFLAAREAALVSNGIHNTELGLTPAGGMSLSLAAGRGWINGYFYLNDTSKTLTIATADGSLPRIDSVVLRWTLDERTITAQVITGTASAAPAAPALVRNASTYDLKLYEIRVPAGTTELTLDLITDTRLDGEVCGIVSGTLSEIDYAEYYQYMRAQFDAFMDSLEDSLSGDTAGNLQLQINELQDKSTVTLTHQKSGTVHALTGLDGRTGIVNAVFKASASFAEGNTFTVDGVSYMAQMPDGEALSDGAFVADSIVGVILDTEGQTVNFKGGGGVKLPALTNPASVAQIFSGYQALNAIGEIMTGTAVPYYFNSASIYINSSKEGRDQTLTCTAAGSEIVLAVACHDKIGDDVGAVGTLLGRTNSDVAGKNTFTEISYSGKTVTLKIDADDAYSGEDWYIWVFSQ